MEIAGKNAVIVGGASGMARASAQLLHERGAAIAILDLAQSAGAEVASQLGGTFHAVDITDDTGVEAAITAAAEALGGMPIAVNPAGGNQPLQVTLLFNLILITTVIAQATADHIIITAAAIFRTEY